MLADVWPEFQPYETGDTPPVSLETIEPSLNPKHEMSITSGSRANCEIGGLIVIVSLA